MKTIRCVISRVWTEGETVPRDWFRDIEVSEIPENITSLELQACPAVALSTSGSIKYVLAVGSSTPMAFQEFYRPYWNGGWQTEEEKQKHKEWDRHFIETLKAHGWKTVPADQPEGDGQ